jgi:hypothetical protein
VYTLRSAAIGRRGGPVSDPKVSRTGSRSCPRSRMLPCLIVRDGCRRGGPSVHSAPRTVRRGRPYSSTTGTAHPISWRRPTDHTSATPGRSTERRRTGTAWTRWWSSRSGRTSRSLIGSSRGSPGTGRRKPRGRKGAGIPRRQRGGRGGVRTGAAPTPRCVPCTTSSRIRWESSRTIPMASGRQPTSPARWPGRGHLAARTSLKRSPRSETREAQTRCTRRGPCGRAPGARGWLGTHGSAWRRGAEDPLFAQRDALRCLRRRGLHQRVHRRALRR